MFERPILNGQCIDSTPLRTSAHAPEHNLHSLLEGFVAGEPSSDFPNPWRVLVEQTLRAFLKGGRWLRWEDPFRRAVVNLAFTE